MNGTTVVTVLVELGVPSAVFGAIGTAYRARKKRQRIIAAAPENKIDTSLARSQQVLTMQDAVNQNLAEDNQRLRVENEQLRTRLANVETQLEAAKTKVVELTDQMSAVTAQLEAIKADLPPHT